MSPLPSKYAVWVWAALACAATRPVRAEPKPSLDELWARRDQGGATEALGRALDAGLEQTPGDFKLLWRASRLCYWRAERLEGAQKVKALQEGLAFAERAAGANKDRVEGPYFAAVNLGAYAEAMGVARALTDGVQGRFLGFVDRTQALDETWDGCGVHVLRGRYYFMVPWPKRDLGRARTELEAARRCGPNVRATVFLAEVLAKDGDPAGARALLVALPKQPGRDAPDDRMMRARGAALLGSVE